MLLFLIHFRPFDAECKAFQIMPNGISVTLTFVRVAVIWAGSADEWSIRVHKN